MGKATKILYNIKEEIEGCDLKELNETNSELYINNKKQRYKTYIIPEKEGIYDIKIKINILMKSAAYFILLIIYKELIYLYLMQKILLI